MSTPQTLDYETILRIVRQWPADRRFVLVQDVLKTLAPAGPEPTTRQPTLSRARGLLATDRPAPSDDDIARWLDERRREQYGV